METFQIIFEPLGIKTSSPSGDTIINAARKAGIGINSLCGGEGICGKCQVQILDDPVSPPTEREKETFGSDQIARGYRLACMTRILGSITIYIPSSSYLTNHQLSLIGTEQEVSFQPPVTELFAELTPPNLNDPRSDQTRLFDFIKNVYSEPVTSVDSRCLQKLGTILRENQWQARVSVRGQEIVDVRSKQQSPLGLAIDLGTTKIAGYLIDMDNGGSVSLGGMVNPQIAYGEDVMSRIASAMNGKETELNRIVIQGLNEMIDKLCPEPDRIVEISLVGNTAMHHFFLGLPVRQLGLSPFVPAVTKALDVKARDLGLKSAPGAYVHILPNIAGFVGADHVAMIMAAGIDQTDRNILGLDIGTNTEVVLSKDGKLTCCSTASGPAFEGGHIKHGMRAASGAIERVRLTDSTLKVETINGAPPIGICGSGVIDTISELLRAGYLDRRGKFQNCPHVRQVNGTSELVLVSEQESQTGRAITFTEKDIREILLAKAAIRAGTLILLKEAGISPEDLDGVIIAGAFGTFLNLESAITIGLLPSLPIEKFQQVGNAAGQGARMALINYSQRTRAAEIADRVHYLELMIQPDFTSLFAGAMYLDPPEPSPSERSSILPTNKYV